MIQLIKALFEQRPKGGGESQERNIRLAAAALLVETARADFSEDGAELDKLSQLLTSSLQLGRAEVQELVIAAQQHADAATSLYELTRVINANCDANQKVQLIRAMWQVAYVDGDLDKYEEHLIRQVADLTFVTHSDYIQCKVSAQTKSAALQGS
jgi:uncharacterized tellurite resistance protein B-like protein